MIYCKDRGRQRNRVTETTTIVPVLKSAKPRSKSFQFCIDETAVRGTTIGSYRQNGRTVRGATTMSKKVLRRQSHSFKAGTTWFGEVLGGTAAVCCCCPFGLVNILFLAFYKVPAGLCRQALKKKQKQRRQHHRIKGEEGLVPPRSSGCSCSCCDENDIRIHPLCAEDVKKSWNLVEVDNEAMELEKEMWDRFYGTGFWRSSSRRYSSQILTATVSNPQFEVTTSFTSTR